MNKPVRSVRFLILSQVVLLLGYPAFPQGKAPKWTEVRSPHFLVATDGSERQGRQLAYHFEAIRSIFEQTLSLRVESGKPFVVIGFKDEKSMRAAMPELWAQKGGVHLAGGFLPGRDKIYAFIRLNAGDEGPYRTVYHEYTHMVLDLNVRSLPLWMEEGLAEFYGFSTIGEKEVSLGRPDINSIMILRQGKRIPLDELFRVTHDSPRYTEAAKASMFYAQSWALTHYLMLTERRETARRDRLSQFLSLLRQGVDGDEATRQVFDDPDELQAALGRYMERSAFPYVRIKTTAAGVPQDYGARLLSQAEMDARLGDFRLHGGRSQDARPLLEEALRLQPDLASAQESLGFLSMQQGDRAEALRHFELAIASDSGNFLAHFYHAILTMNGLGTSDGNKQAAASLENAIRLNPYFAPAYDALAGLYLMDEQKSDRALELARKAVSLEPGSFSYQMMLGTALVRSGRYEEALKLARAMERSGGSQDDKDLARSLIENLNQIQGKKDPGPERRPKEEPGRPEDREPVAGAEARSVSYSWSVLDRPTPGSNSLLAEGSGDALYASCTYDEVWAAVIKMLAKDYKVRLSDKNSGHFIVVPNATSNTDPAFETLDIRIEQRGPDVGVNVAAVAKTEMPLPKKTSFFNSLFEEIAIILTS